MTWLRCARCESVFNLDREPRCWFCKAEPGRDAPLIELKEPEAHAEADSDISLSRWGWMTLGALGAFGLAGTLARTDEGDLALAILGVGTLSSLIVGPFLGARLAYIYARSAALKGDKGLVTCGAIFIGVIVSLVAVYVLASTMCSVAGGVW